MRKTMAGFLAVIFILSLCVACRTPAGRTSGQVVDDSAITAEVKSKLLADSVTQGLAISVQTFEGQVTLTGAVGNEAQKSRATQVVRQVNGVKKVNNLLQVRGS